MKLTEQVLLWPVPELGELQATRILKRDYGSKIESLHIRTGSGKFYTQFPESEEWLRILNKGQP